MELLKLLSTNEIVVQVINFLLLLFILRLFLWKRVLKLLDDRKARISDELNKIEEAKKTVEALKSEYQTKLNSIEEIARVSVNQAKQVAREVAEQIRVKANTDADKIIESARQEIQFEVAKAKEELKDQIVDLTIRAAENLISERLTEEDDIKIVEDFINQVDKTK